MPRLAAWARALDVVAVACVVLAVLVVTFGGFRLNVAGWRLSVTSAPRLLIWTVAIVALRHLVVRDDPVHRRLARGLRSRLRSPAVALVWPPFIVTRLGVLIVGYLAVVTIGYPPEGPGFRVSNNELLNLPARWDAGWYLHIAAFGYSWDPEDTLRQQSVVFFPAFPFLMRAGGILLGGRPLLAGLIISLACFLAALVYLFRLAREELEPESARAAIVLLACYPFAVFYSAPYTEGLFLLGSAAAFYHFRRGEQTRAAGWGLVVGLTRPNGFLLTASLGVLALQQAIRQSNVATLRVSAGTARGLARGTPFLVAAMPTLGMLLYCAYLGWRTGWPLAWVHGQAAWGRAYGGIHMLVAERFEYIAAHGLYRYTASMPIDLLHAMAVLFAVALLWPVTRRLGVAYGMFVAANLLPPLFVGGLLSMGRVTSVLFPIFMWLGASVPARQRPAWIAAFAMGQALAAAIFFTWRPLY